jgi:hypothetical protein
MGFPAGDLQADELPGRSMKLVCCLKSSQPIVIVSRPLFSFAGRERRLNCLGQYPSTGPDYLA